MDRRSILAAWALAAALAAGCAAPGPADERAARGAAAPAAGAPRVTPGAPEAVLLPAEPDALAAAMRGVPIVLLGEVHDNAGQHALRARALAARLAAGERFAIAFEQLDRERQPEVERARRERPRDADHLIARAGAPGWDWTLYRPFVQLALEHDLPIVAANLSRADASRVVREGLGAAFDAPARRALGLDDLPGSLLAAHQREVDVGHCGMLPAAMHAPMARAQIARDAALAAAIEPHASGNVVLLTGNGHVRRDLGVARWLSPGARGRTLAIGLLERERADGDPRADDGRFDAVVLTPPVERGDPCASLRPGRGSGAPRGGRAPPQAAGRPASTASTNAALASV